ncbi:hypothetical protein V1478_010615 [Vespula squamosa]|uniref:Uncharacterized protein n=1 Tax=Vespula squamosa TaxID=30214 RepID=A0ABD2AIA5_VESSQ
MNNVIRELISHQLSFVVCGSQRTFRDSLYILSRTIEIAFFKSGNCFIKMNVTAQALSVSMKCRACIWNHE